MNTPDELRAAAARYRRLIPMVTDQAATAALRQLADEYQALAEQKERVADRASLKVDGGDQR